MLLVIVFFYVCCSSEPNNHKDYQQYIQDLSNGFTKNKEVGPFVFTLTHLPSKALALKESEYGSNAYDKALDEYSNGLYFSFTISPNHKIAEGDVARASMMTISDYEDRMKALHFRFKDYWTLETPEGKFTPVLSQLEQTTGLTDYRRFQLVFTSDKSNKELSKPWKLIYEDEIWESGVSEWVYE